MTAASPSQPLTAEEQEQIRQTVEMFEVITQANPLDTQSMEILKDAYLKLDQEENALGVSRRLADAYMGLEQYSSALLEYEAIIQKNPSDAEAIAALGMVEQRLQETQRNATSGQVEIDLDFKSVVEGGNLIATRRTQSSERVVLSGQGDIASKLEGSDDGNDQLVRFLCQNRLVSEDVVQQALVIVRKKNKERAGQQVAASLLDEIVTRGAVNVEQLLCGILDRSKFAYIPLECYDIDRQIVKMLPEDLTVGRLIVPFDIISRTMMVAVANPFDSVGKEAVQQLLDYNIQWHLADPASIITVLGDTYKL